MSTEVALFGGKYPAQRVITDPDDTTLALVGTGGGSHHRISIRGSVFRMIVNGKQIAENEDRAMNIVVVRAATATNRQYYEGAYEEGVASAPTCYSPDGITPDPASVTPQGRTCASCPQNIAGSGQGESRACRYQHRLAVVLEGDLEGPVYQLAVPATSLFGAAEGGKMPLRAYATHLNTHGASITALVTQMRFDTKSSTPKLTFKEIRPLSEEEFEIVKEQGSSDAAKEAVELTVFQQDSTPVAKAAKAKAAVVVEDDDEAPVAKVAKPKAAVVVEDDDEDEAPKVVPKPAKPAGPAAKRPVSEIIDSWDD